MNRVLTACFAAAVGLMAGSAFAQEPPKFPEPQPEHAWLNQFVGEWESASEATMGPGQPPMRCAGTIKARMLGGFWMVGEMKSASMGIEVSGLLTLGYDPQKKKYVGTWVDSMQSTLWQYVGTVEEGGKKIVLEAEGPNFMADNKLTKFRDTYEFKSADEVAITSSMLGDDGKWITFMTGEARRKK
jgi:hypothetical protein